MSKYLEIAEAIENEIMTHKLSNGDQIPTEKELMGQYKVSRQTVRNAIAFLSSKGLVYSIKGAGTFVSELSSPTPASNNIAVIITNPSSYIFPYKSASINSVLSKTGYISNVFSSDNRIDMEENIIQQIMFSNYAGVILEINKAVIPRVNNLILELAERIPTILIDGYYPQFPTIPYVSLDDKKGGFKATEYLIQQGHKEIFHVGKIDDLQGHLRYQGYTEALCQYDLNHSDDLVYWINDSQMYSMPQSLLESICDRIMTCTAVFFYNDQVCECITKELLHRGIRIPEDLSVISYDNSIFSASPMNLSCIAYPLNTLGAKAAEQLIKMIENPSYDGTYIFEPELVERTSVKKI